MDFHIQDNGALTAKTYCFRAVEQDGTVLTSYNADGYGKVETFPGTANLMRHGNVFIDGTERGFFWAE